MYPWLAVLLPPGYLSTYAFYLSEGRPSALLSAIAACVTVCCREEEAPQTIRSSARREQREHRNTTIPVPGPSATRQEIARYHCRTAEILLQRDHDLLKSLQAGKAHSGNSKPRFPGIGTPTGDAFGRHGSIGGGEVDVELLQIEKSATRVLLAHYHYGAGPDATHRMAFDHAKKAWTMAAQWDLTRPLKTEEGVSKLGGFGQLDRCEWKRRIHWLAYTAATHLSCLGGFVSDFSFVRV